MDISKSEDKAEIISFAEAWAKLMEDEMASGKPLASIHMATAMATARYMKLKLEAFDFLCAMSHLTVNWAHGRELHEVYAQEEQKLRDREARDDNSGEIKL